MANVGGTTHAVELARSLEVGCLHHVSSIAVAGAPRGRSARRCSTRARAALSVPPHEVGGRAARARAAVRAVSGVPAGERGGTSETGEIDKVEGPTTSSRRSSGGGRLPKWLPLGRGASGAAWCRSTGWRARRAPDARTRSRGNTFHLIQSLGQRVDELIDELATARPRPPVRRQTRQAEPPRAAGVAAVANEGAAPVAAAARPRAPGAGDPRVGARAHAARAVFDGRHAAGRSPARASSTPPEHHGYAQGLWAYWEREMDPNVSKERTLQEAVRRQESC